MPSTLIRSFSYDAERGTLDIVFVRGAVYRYFEVPAEIAAAMRQAFAKGEYFNAHIRGAFPHQRLVASS